MGTLLMHSGSLLISNGIWVADDNNDVGVFVATGGTITVVDQFYLADNVGSSADAAFGGDLIVNIGNNLIVGQSGEGILVIDGNASVDVGNEVRVGRNSVSSGDLTIDGNAFVNIGDNLQVAFNLDSTGRLHIINGTVVVGNSIEVGGRGPGTFILDGGLVDGSANGVDLNIGFRDGSPPIPLSVFPIIVFTNLPPVDVGVNSTNSRNYTLQYMDTNVSDGNTWVDIPPVDVNGNNGLLIFPGNPGGPAARFWRVIAEVP